MKIFNLFAHLFAILAFLTLGSLLIIVSMHILAVDDAVLQLRQLYESPWHSLQAGLLGLVFIVVGLTFTKLLLKKRRQSEAIIFSTDIGPVVISDTAIEDVVKKVLKRYHLIKDWKVKTAIQGKDVEIKLRLVLWSGGRLQELLFEVQEEMKGRLRKLLGNSGQLEITCDVQKIEDHEPDLPEFDRDEAVSI